MDKRDEIRIPVDAHEKLGRVYRAMKALSAKLNREPTIREISKVTQIKANRIKELLSYAEINSTMWSLDFELESGTSYSEYVPDESQDIYTEVEQREVSGLANEYLGRKLSARDIDILKRRVEGELLHEIGDDYGICRERVRQIEAKMKTRLKRHKKLAELIGWEKKNQLSQARSGNI